MGREGDCLKARRLTARPGHIIHYDDHMSQSGDHISQSGDHISQYGDHIIHYGDHISQSDDHMVQAQTDDNINNLMIMWFNLMIT